MGAIYRRELSSFFTSPIAYVFLAVFNIFAGIFFTSSCLSYATTDMAGVYGNMFLMLLFLFPILTMRLFSEEKKNKTDQCLLTSPVGLTSIVVGKYLAAVTVFAVSLITFIIYAVILAAFSPVSWAILIGSILGTFFTGVAFIAVGVFVSSLTENQIVAAIGGFVLMTLMYLVDLLAQSVTNTNLQNFIMKFSFYSKYSEFSTGIFNISSILFFISTAVIFNFLTIRVLEKRRWG